MTINSSIGVDHHHHHHHPNHQQNQHHLHHSHNHNHHHHSHDHHHHQHQHNCQSNQRTVNEKGVQVEQDVRPTANLNDDDDDDEKKEQQHQPHHLQQQCNKKIKKKDIVQCSSPPIQSVLVGLVGTAQKTQSTLVNSGDGGSVVNGNGDDDDDDGKTSPLLMPPKPIQRRSKQQSRPNTVVIQQNLDTKPVDVNNNKSSKKQQQQQSKVAIIRQQSCPVSGQHHHHHHYNHQQKQHHNHNHRHVHHHPTIYRPILKEKITRVDMVPAPEIDQNILPPLDNCENDTALANNDDGNDLKHSNQIKQQASMVQQLSEWKEKLSRELDVYQDILKQRHALRSSHSNSSSNAQDSQPVKHSKKVATGHRSSFRSKTLKFANPKRLATLKQSHSIRKSDSFEDSLDDSWEETETSTTTNSTENNTNCSTPTGNAKPKLVVDDAIQADQKRIGSVNSNGGKYRMLMKKSASQKQTSAKNPPIDSLKLNGSGGESGKRRSTSFNRKVKIVTQYEKILQAMESDKTWQKEIAFGRRIGLYRFRGDIGNGNFSQVKIAIHTLTKEKVAVKILDKSRLDIKTQRMLTREIRTMETLHHPNLIRIFEVIESYSKHFIVMELAPGGELFQVISTNGRFSESEAKFFFSQIISAIDHMHQHNLIHRDIKAENVFFSDPCTVKVGDFGFSTRITSKDELLSTFCGSPPYAAPELFRDESYRGPYVDYWALGVLLYFIITGMMPFRAQNIVALKKLILDCRYDIPGYVSVECCQLIAGFLQPEPLKRFTLEQARSTRWLGDQPVSKSLPKYDLKSSYAKLIKQRAMMATTADAESKKIAYGSNPDSLDLKPGSEQNTIQDEIQTDSPKHFNKRHTVYADMQYSNAIINGDLKTSETCPPLNDDEKEAFHQMMLLGIDEKILNSHVDKGSHSHIVGTFRILMHGVLRESNSRKRNILRNGEILDNSVNGLNPIRRSTSMNVAPLDRIWAHYAKKAQQQRQQGNLDNKNKIPNLPPSTVKCPTRSAKMKKNETMMTKTSQSSYDSGKSSSVAAEVKTPNRLKKIFNGRSSASPEPPKPTMISESNKCTTTPKIDSESKDPDPVDKVDRSTPVEELKIKEKLRKEDQSMVAKPKNNQTVQKQQSLNMPNIKDNNRNDPNATLNVGTQNGNCVGGRLGRSFRTLKQLLTESNICGNNIQTVIQPQPANPIKQHVIHKTTTLQIMPRNCQTLTNQQQHLSSYAQPPSSTHPIWQLNSEGGDGSKRKSKLWRSQTTPDVSLINGNGTAHHHLTLPCYCDQMLMMNQNVYDEATNSPAFRSNKKSFNANNRCTIV